MPMQNASSSATAPQPTVTVPWDEPVDPDYQHASYAAREHFCDMKFGLRIHFYVSSQIGAKLGSWWLYEHPLAEQAQYHQLYRTFNPTGYDADEWVRMMVDGGCRYFTFVSKHHDGFALWDTKTRVRRRTVFTGTRPRAGQSEPCDLAYSVMESPFGRDIMRELVEASRRAGLGVGLYFSHWDWYDADFRWSGIGEVAYEDGFAAGSDPAGYARFLGRYRQQIREICTGFGPLDLIEWDCEPRGTYEAFRARGIRDWTLLWPDIKPIIKMARRLQPDALFRERGIGAYGDFHTPEWQIPKNADPTSESQGVHLWQVIYPCFEESPSWMLDKLIDVVAKGGNLQLGFLPGPDGRFSTYHQECLRYLGDWLKVNGEAIYCTRPRSNGVWGEGDLVRFTRSKDERTLYAIALAWPGTQLPLRSVQPAPGSRIGLLGTQRDLPWRAADTGIVIDLPADLQSETARACRQAFAFRITMT
ncbi:MAG: alpha-L-fucosidase [Phycisphaeraceae bacterium]